MSCLLLYTRFSIKAIVKSRLASIGCRLRDLYLKLKIQIIPRYKYLIARGYKLDDLRVIYNLLDVSTRHSTIIRIGYSISFVLKGL